MPELELRAKIRELMASGALPSEPPVIQRSGREAVGARRQDTCAICAEPVPRREVEARRARDHEVRMLLETALRKLEEGPS